MTKESVLVHVEHGNDWTKDSEQLNRGGWEWGERNRDRTTALRVKNKNEGREGPRWDGYRM